MLVEDIGQQEPSFGEQKPSQIHECQPTPYVAKLCDKVDQMLAVYLNSDQFAKKMQLPVVRLERGTYLIGLAKWSMRLNKQFKLEVKGESSKKWYLLRHVLLNTYQS